MHYRSLFAALAGVAAVMVLPLAPSAQAATRPVQFGLIYDNSPGSARVSAALISTHVDQGGTDENAGQASTSSATARSTAAIFFASRGSGCLPRR